MALWIKYYIENVDVNFYVNINDKFFDDEQYFENLFGRIENETAVVFNALINDSANICNKTLQAKIAFYLYTLSIRTSTKRNLNSFISNSLYEQLGRLSKEGIQELCEKFHPNNDNAKIFQLMEILNAKEQQEKIHLLLNGYSWNIGINNTDVKFILSDNPAWGVYFPLKDICIPISPQKAIILRTNEHESEIFSEDYPQNGIINLSLKSVLTYNLLQGRFGHKYIFGDYKSLEINNNIEKPSGNSHTLPQIPLVRATT